MSVSIRTAGNTILPTLLAIQSKGYSINLKYIYTGDMYKLNPIYSAEKEGYMFTAKDAEGLLGLIAMWEHRGDNWQCESPEKDDLKQGLIDFYIIYDSEGDVIYDSEEKFS